MLTTHTFGTSALFAAQTMFDLVGQIGPILCYGKVGGAQIVVAARFGEFLRLESTFAIAIHLRERERRLRSQDEKLPLSQVTASKGEPRRGDSSGFIRLGRVLAHVTRY